MGCAIVTTEATDHLKDLHDRMPFIIQRSHYKDWIQNNDGNFFDEALAKRIKFYPVSTYVNNPSHNDENCIFEA
jgi:putative SOS response-associated peptidase YedK